jgi:hypothetical protein
MLRSLTSLVLVALVAVPAFSQGLDEARLLKVAEQRVVEVLRDRPELLGQLPRVAGSALIDGDHVQVDAYYVKDDAVVPHSAERFIFTVSSDHVDSVGAPHGEVATLTGRQAALEKARTDAVARFSKEHPGTGAEVADGTAPRIKTERTDSAGGITVVVESFGGIAGMWMGDSISYSYASDGSFIDQLHD